MKLRFIWKVGLQKETRIFKEKYNGEKIRLEISVKFLTTKDHFKMQQLVHEFMLGNLCFNIVGCIHPPLTRLINIFRLLGFAWVFRRKILQIQRRRVTDNGNPSLFCFRNLVFIFFRNLNISWNFSKLSKHKNKIHRFNCWTMNPSFQSILLRNKKFKKIFKNSKNKCGKNNRQTFKQLRYILREQEVK